MKKLLFSALIVGLVFTSSCNKDDDGGGKSCERLAEEYLAAAEAYSSDNSVANCNAFKSSLQAFINKNCAGGQEAALQTQLDALVCN